ncbi:MAG: nucleoside-diphosphate kinase [Candidatus Dormibacteraeota bacterium]|nr:nucleoside-diphosphate kinase [Candidatus Dormibacteraeota bacterium]
MSTERTLVLVKPDGVQRGLVAEVIGRFERRGLHLVAMRMLLMDRSLAERHYAEHVGKPFFEGLVAFITSAPVVAMVWEAPGAVALVRSVMGATDPKNSAPGTIRGDLAVSIGANVVHGSDSPGRAVEEISLFFEPGALVEWTSAAQDWVVSS